LGQACQQLRCSAASTALVSTLPLVAKHAVVVDGHPDAAVITQKITQQLQPRQPHRQPLRMLQVVVAVLKRTLRVVGRIARASVLAQRSEKRRRGSASQG